VIAKEHQLALHCILEDQSQISVRRAGSVTPFCGFPRSSRRYFLQYGWAVFCLAPQNS